MLAKYYLNSTFNTTMSKSMLLTQQISLIVQTALVPLLLLQYYKSGNSQGDPSQPKIVFISITLSSSSSSCSLQ